MKSLDGVGGLERERGDRSRTSGPRSPRRRRPPSAPASLIHRPSRCGRSAARRRILERPGRSATRRRPGTGRMQHSFLYDKRRKAAPEERRGAAQATANTRAGALLTALFRAVERSRRFKRPSPTNPRGTGDPAGAAKVVGRGRVSLAGGEVFTPCRRKADEQGCGSSDREIPRRQGGKRPSRPSPAWGWPR